jgi:hypothetical protein
MLATVGASDDHAVVIGAERPREDAHDRTCAAARRFARISSRGGPANPHAPQCMTSGEATETPVGRPQAGHSARSIPELYRR